MVKETSRASWGLSYEKGLVDILVEHNVPIYRGQNGWVAEGWRSITAKFNQKFPCAQYTKQQIQEKEKDMKANYKAFQQARKMSGTGWDDNLSMIIAEPVIWEKLKKVKILLSSACNFFLQHIDANHTVILTRTIRG